MGTHWFLRPENREAYARSVAAQRGHETRLLNKKRMTLADKIVMAVVDRIAADIIRPGPVAEERECYVMAQELREHTLHLSELVSSILKIEEDED